MISRYQEERAAWSLLKYTMLCYVWSSVNSEIRAAICLLQISGGENQKIRKYENIKYLSLLSLLRSSFTIHRFYSR